MSIAAAWLSGGAAHAQTPSVRVAVVLDERVDDERRPESDVEAVVTDALASRPEFVLVDPEQAQRVRLATHGSSLLEADVDQLVTALDADFLLVGEIRFSMNDTEGTGLSVHSFSVRGRTKLIAVDSAQILGAPRPRGNAFHPASREAALFRGATACGEDLVEAVVEIIESRLPRRAELFVDVGAPLDPSAIHETLECVADEMGAPARLLVQHERGFHVELTTDDSAIELARRFGSAGLCGLRIRGSSRHALRAQYAPRVLVPVMAARFELRVQSEGGKTRSQWLRDEVPRSLLADLSDLHFTEIDPRLELRDRLPPKAKKALGISGRIVKSEAETRISARVTALYRRKTILSEHVSCPNDGIGACMGRLTDAISSQLFDRVLANRHVIPVGKEIAVGRQRRVLKLSTPEIPDLYPARLAHYDEFPLGEIEVTNISEEEVTEISAFAMLEGLSKSQPIAVPAERLPPTQSISVPFQLALNPSRLEAHDENATRLLSLRVEYRIGEFTYTQKRSRPVMVYSRNALDWNDHGAVAAFVTADEPRIADLVTRVRTQIPPEYREDRFATPVALFRALRDLEYAPDRANPYRPGELDYVQYPIETLVKGGGDCDDLAVTYASLLESAGHPALLVQTPGHVFVAFETSVAPSNARIFAANEHGVIAHGGRAWIPVETTKVSSSFRGAMDAAAEELREVASANAAPRLTEIRVAWREHRPVRLYRVGPIPNRTVDGADIAAELDAIRERREEQVARTIEALRTSSGPRELNRLGVIYAQIGRLEEARAAFRESFATQRGPAALNNEGNLDLMDARADAALQRYERSLEMAPKRVEIRLNALLASHLLASTDETFEERRAEHVAEAIELDPARLRAFLMRLPGGELPGAESTSSSLTGLRVVLERQLESSGHRPPQTTARAGSGLVFEQQLHWLEL